MRCDTIIKDLKENWFLCEDSLHPERHTVQLNLHNEVDVQVCQSVRVCLHMRVAVPVCLSVCVCMRMRPYLCVCVLVVSDPL